MVQSTTRASTSTTNTTPATPVASNTLQLVGASAPAPPTNNEDVDKDIRKMEKALEELRRKKAEEKRLAEEAARKKAKEEEAK